MKTGFTLLFWFVFILYGCSQNFTFHNPDDTSNGRRVFALASQNEILIAHTKGDSLLRYENDSWSFIGKYQNGFDNWVNNTPNDMAFAPDGDLWISYFKGIDRYDGVSSEYLLSDNSPLPQDFQFSLAIDNNGRVYMGHANGSGLSIFEDGNWTTKGDFTDGLEELNSVFSPDVIWYDEVNDAIWVVDNLDYIRIKDDEMTIFNTQIPNLSSDDIAGITQTTDGNIWFALSDNSGSNGGLLQFNGTDFTHFPAVDNNFPDSDFSTIAAIGNDLFLTGFNQKSVFKFDGTTWLTYDNTNSNFPEFFFANFYKMIVWQNELWMGTSNGIVQFDPMGTSANVAIDKPADFQLFPNPANDVLQLKTEEVFSQITFFDFLGKELMQRPFASELNIEQLPDGMYFLQIENKEQQFFVEKFIKGN